MQSYKSKLAFIFFLTFTFLVLNAQKAFPDAEGYGQNTKGGRGGVIIRVTNLNDLGSGSLRAALEMPGARTVVFEVSGTINLNSKITITNPYLTIAGQTAPSPGILVRGGTIVIKAHNVLIQHIRVRLGNVSDDCIKISTAGTTDVFNVYLDHVSLSWANDENLSFFQRDGFIRDISISHCIISEALAKNSTYQNSKAFLITKDPNSTIGTEIGDFSITKSLFSSNNQRNPEMVNGSKSILVNNVTYGYRHSALAIGNSTGQFKVANVNNIYKTRVTALRPPVYLREGATGQLFMSNNQLDGLGLTQLELLSRPYALLTSSPMNLSVMSIIPVDETFDYVLTYVGARPIDRDAVDLRIINEVSTGTGDWMDKTEVENMFPSLIENNRLFNIANPNADDDGDGYTNLEEELNIMKLDVEGLGAGLSVILNNKAKYSLNLKNYPNPFATETTIEYTLMEASKVDLKIYSVTGMLINDLLQEYQEPGIHKIIWNNSLNNKYNTQKGIYIYRLIIDNEVYSGKLHLF